MSCTTEKLFFSFVDQTLQYQIHSRIHARVPVLAKKGSIKYTAEYMQTCTSLGQKRFFLSFGGEYTAEILTMVSWEYNTLNYNTCDLSGRENDAEYSVETVLPMTNRYQYMLNIVIWMNRTKDRLIFTCAMFSSPNFLNLALYKKKIPRHIKLAVHV